MKGCNVYAGDKAARGRGGNCLLFSINSLWLFRCLLSAKYSGFQLSTQTLSAGIRWEKKFRKIKEFRKKSTQDSKSLLLENIFPAYMFFGLFSDSISSPHRLPGHTVMRLILLELSRVLLFLNLQGWFKYFYLGFWVGTWSSVTELIFLILLLESYCSHRLAEYGNKDFLVSITKTASYLHNFQLLSKYVTRNFTKEGFVHLLKN